MKKQPTNPLDRILGQYADKLKVSTNDNLGSLDLLDFMVTASPYLRRPDHLESIVPYLTACENAPQFFAFSAPPRHGKSLLINHFVAWMMIRHPGIRIAYGCYGEQLALFFSDQVKDILRSNRIELDRTHNSRSEWRLSNGSSFMATAPGGSFTGMGADLIILDDPYKNRMAAESGAVRDTTWSWFTGVAMTRRSPNASVICTHTRWCMDDLIGRLEREHQKLCSVINLPALGESNEPLWPSEWPEVRLAEIRATIGEYDWASLYMGSPRPRGGAVFNTPKTYGVSEHDTAELPKKFKRITIGIDLAYTKKVHSDYSVAVVLGADVDGQHFVLEVIRKQVEAPAFALILKALRMKWEGAPVYWSVGGTEKAVADLFLNSFGIPIKAVPAREDKFVRAQAVAAAWNAGKVLVPSDDASWMGPFLEEVLGFTGLDDVHDDCVDALAAAFLPSAGKKVKRGMGQEPLGGLM